MRIRDEIFMSKGELFGEKGTGDVEALGTLVDMVCGAKGNVTCMGFLGL